MTEKEKLEKGLGSRTWHNLKSQANELLSIHTIFFSFNLNNEVITLSDVALLDTSFTL
jgi:hypothetical protein